MQSFTHTSSLETLDKAENVPLRELIFSTTSKK